MLQNLHTHTRFCDGNDTPKELVDAAISKGFDSLGFSSHAPTSLRDDCEMSNTDQYIRNISTLKDEYSEKIELFLGVELDYYSKGLINPRDFDYSISSVHYSVLPNGNIITYDHSPERTEKHITEDFAGDGLAYARSYFERVSLLTKETDVAFVGHFDLVSKFSDIRPDFFDTESILYRSYAMEALHTLSERFDFFEVNTGAIARGFKRTPYPAPFILEEMRKLKTKLVLTSDCHRKGMLDFSFKEAREYLISHGFDELYFLTKNGFVGEKI